MSETRVDLHALSSDECRHLLLSYRPRLGRLAFSDQGRPLVLPMNFAVRGDAIYFRSAEGTKLAAAAKGGWAAFEVDDVNEVWEDGWSVLAHGTLHLVSDAAELEVVDGLPLRPWAGGDRPHYLRLDVEALSGRRIS